jgi:hypothetical protein
VDSRGHIWLPSVFFLIVGLVLSTVLMTDFRGFATRALGGRRRYPLSRRSPEPLPRWQVRLASIWPLMFGVGQFVFWRYIIQR